jgi:hypothetical protein
MIILLKLLYLKHELKDYINVHKYKILIVLIHMNLLQISIRLIKFHYVNLFQQPFYINIFNC